MKKIIWIFGLPLLLLLATAGFWYGFPSLDGGGSSKAQQAEWQREGKPYTLVLLTVFNPNIGGRQYSPLPLMAKLGIHGARNLSTVCRRLPYVLEATLGALSRSGSDMLDDEGRFRIATQNGNVRDAINRSLEGVHVKNVALTLAIISENYKRPSELCREGEEKLARF